MILQVSMSKLSNLLGRCIDGATSHRDEAGMKMTFTLHEVILDEARLGL